MMNRKSKDIIYSYPLFFPRFYAFFRFLILPIEKIEKLVPQEGNILDVGCGYGLTSFYLALSFPKRFVLGLELNRNRVILASKINHLKNLSFQTANLIGKTKKSFDTILAVDLLHHLSKSDQSKFFVDASKLTRSGNLLVIKDIEKKFTFGYFWNFVHDLLASQSFQINYLTSKTIIKMAKVTGFALKETHLLNSFFYPHILYVFKKK